MAPGTYIKVIEVNDLRKDRCTLSKGATQEMVQINPFHICKPF